MNGVWNAKASHQGHRLRGRHGRAHVVGLVGAGALPDPRQAHRLRQARVPAAQPGADHGRHRHAVGRLVRLQRRQRGRRRRHRRQRLHDHHARHRGRRRGLAAARVDHARQAHRARLLLGRGRRPGRHHAGRRLRHAVERRAHRRPRGRRAVPRLHQAQGDLQVRRRARHLRRARRRRHAGRAASPASSPRPTSTPTSTPTSAALVGKTLWLEQLKAMGLTLALSIGGTVVHRATSLKAVLGLRPSVEDEETRPRRRPTTARPATTPTRAATTAASRRRPSRSSARRAREWPKSGGATNEEGRGDHQAVQARRGEGPPAPDRHLGHDRHRGEGLRPHRRQDRGLPGLGVRRRLRAEGEASRSW